MSNAASETMRLDLLTNLINLKAVEIWNRIILSHYEV